MMKDDMVTIKKGFSPNQYMLLKYEDLIAAEKRLNVLEGIINFLNFRSPIDRLNCSFELADR